MKGLLLTILTFLSFCLQAQVKTIIGKVFDSHSEEPLLFASVYFNISKTGITADSVGQFIINKKVPVNDTLLVSSVGYEPKKYFIGDFPNDTLLLNIYLNRVKNKEEVVVRVKVNRGLALWRKIVRNRDNNDKFKLNAFSYNLYNKMELDIVNLNKEKLKEVKLLKPFSFILDNIDSTSEIQPFLPIYITETFSKYYLQNNPRKTKEIITASKTSGIENESATKLMGGMYANINIYKNFIPVFNSDFVSPFSENGDGYYSYKVRDTQLIGGRRTFKLTFTPRKIGYNTFNGECWVDDTTFAITNITLALNKEANINYVEQLSLFQEFKRIETGGWMLSKEKTAVNIAPVGKNKLTITGRKTTQYSDISLNQDSIKTILSTNKTKEDIILLPNALQQNELFWQKQRPEALTKNESFIYKLVDTLNNMPLFKKYSNTINFLTTGTKWVNKFEIGPWYNWISGNVVEGTRVRFDLGTNTKFSKKVYLHGYGAYGFLDKKFKGKFEAFWLPKKEPRMWFYAGFQEDYDNGQVYYDEVSQDNIFSLAIRKPNVPNKFIFVNQKNLEFFSEIGKGFSVHLGFNQKRFTPIRNLPAKEEFPTEQSSHESLNNFESFVKLRFAHLERFIEGNFYRTSLGSPLPIVELKWNKGYKNIFGSAYKYNKLAISVSDFLKTPPFGNIYYNFFAGKIFGTLPFTLLETHPGNEIFYYNKYAFNMMNRFEYISDEFAGINVEHNFGNGVFRYIPITRKLKFRQFWNAKFLWGNLNANNIALNVKAGNNLKTLNNNGYIELGTGIDNIFKVLRLDCVWRVAPTPLPANRFQRFAVFGSFRLAF